MTRASASPFERLTVIGFGLVGASVALSARRAGQVAEVTAIDRAEVTRSTAARAAADLLVDASDERRVHEAVAGADLVLLATPVGVIETMVTGILETAALVTDAGSTKRAIVRAAARSSRRDRFVAGHPMAGGQRGGAEHARADLFERRPWILCPEGSAPDALERVEGFVHALGAIPRRLSAAEHDRAVALTSHVPQLLASALAVRATERAVRDAAGPGFESATRVAGGEEAMWRDILSTNADEIEPALAEIVDELTAIQDGLRRSPPDLTAVLSLLERARSSRSEGD